MASCDGTQASAPAAPAVGGEVQTATIRLRDPNEAPVRLSPEDVALLERAVILEKWEGIVDHEETERLHALAATLTGGAAALRAAPGAGGGARNEDVSRTRWYCTRCGISATIEHRYADSVYVVIDELRSSHRLFAPDDCSGDLAGIRLELEETDHV